MTQSERIIAYIKEYGSITPYEAFADLGITKLATRISEMTAQGMEFDKVVETSNNRYVQNVHYMRYSLRG